jgi:ABC-type multidrug transport system ATPase subunit
MAIVVENLTKKYCEQKVVNDISFEVKTGEVVGFLGPNGAVKSTTMKMITCFMAPTDGDIKLDTCLFTVILNRSRKKLDIYRRTTLSTWICQS